MLEYCARYTCTCSYYTCSYNITRMLEDISTRVGIILPELTIAVGILSFVYLLSKQSTHATPNTCTVAQTLPLSW